MDVSVRSVLALLAIPSFTASALGKNSRFGAWGIFWALSSPNGNADEANELLEKGDRCLIQQLAAAQEKVKGKSSRRPWHFPLPPLIFRVLGLFPLVFVFYGHFKSPKYHPISTKENFSYYPTKSLKVSNTG